MRYKPFLRSRHRKVCWLTHSVRKDRRLDTDLRFALVSELARVPDPTDTYGPHCRSQRDVLSR